MSVVPLESPQRKVEPESLSTGVEIIAVKAKPTTQYTLPGEEETTATQKDRKVNRFLVRISKDNRNFWVNPGLGIVGSEDTHNYVVTVLDHNPHVAHSWNKDRSLRTLYFFILNPDQHMDLLSSEYKMHLLGSQGIIEASSSHLQGKFLNLYVDEHNAPQKNDAYAQEARPLMGRQINGARFELHPAPVATPSAIETIVTQVVPLGRTSLLSSDHAISPTAENCTTVSTPSIVTCEPLSLASCGISVWKNKLYPGNILIVGWPPGKLTSGSVNVKWDNKKESVNVEAGENFLKENGEEVLVAQPFLQGEQGAYILSRQYFILFVIPAKGKAWLFCALPVGTQICWQHAWKFIEGKDLGASFPSAFNDWKQKGRKGEREEMSLDKCLSLVECKQEQQLQQQQAFIAQQIRQQQDSIAQHQQHWNTVIAQHQQHWNTVIAQRQQHFNAVFTQRQQYFSGGRPVSDGN
ncbi:hypothetical protein BGZ63DRAFT_435551 [Mariannaea sp. PMI_226]|nr:hypothetical protein BGZ63DRAFT_435551 [Mariannaea sp. PMI_226]